MSDVHDGRAAFVATTGGHLVQLLHLAPLVEPDRHQSGLWITHRSPQSESLLEGLDSRFVPFVPARRVDRALIASPRMLRLLHEANVDTVYSTGAALALSVLPISRLVGARPIFIESLARPEAPSLTGNVLASLPWVECFTQYRQNASRRWQYEHDLLQRFRAEPVDGPAEIRRVLVTLGTARPWGFGRLLNRLISVLPEGMDVVWQTGATDTHELPIVAVEMMSDADLQAQIRQADVVVAHAGVGTVLRCLEAGKAPVLVPRRAFHGEHVDDHQVQIARVAEGRGLAVHADADEIALEHLQMAAARRITKQND